MTPSLWNCWRRSSWWRHPFKHSVISKEIQNDWSCRWVAWWMHAFRHSVIRKEVQNGWSCRWVPWWTHPSKLRRGCHLSCSQRMCPPTLATTTDPTPLPTPISAMWAHHTKVQVLFISFHTKPQYLLFDLLFSYQYCLVFSKWGIAALLHNLLQFSDANKPYAIWTDHTTVHVKTLLHSFPQLLNANDPHLQFLPLS